MSDPTQRLAEADFVHLAELAEKLREGTIADDEVVELEILLAESPGALDAFAQLAMLTAELRHAQGRLSLPKQPAARGKIIPLFQRGRVRWLAAAAIVLLAITGWQFFAARISRPHSWQLSATPNPAPASAGATVAEISNASGAALRCAGKEISADTGRQLEAGAYELRLGLIELKYPNGVVLLIESPARFELRDAKTIGLPSGNLTARIPKAAAGFTVETASGNVVDLGTEFGVSANAQSSQVHVFKGEVLVKTPNEPEPLHLKEAHASSIDRATHTPTGIEFEPDRFIRSLDEPSGGYVNQILHLQPVAYYRMEASRDPTILRDRAPERHHGQVILGNSSTPWGPGRLGTSLRLGGPESRSYAVVNRFPKATNNLLSVCAWVRADSRPRWASIAKNWAKDAGSNFGGQFHFGLCMDKGDLEAHVHDAAGQEVWVREETPLPLNQWQFVAFTLDGATLRLYRNGREVKSAPCAGLNTFAPDALGIGVKLNRTGTQPEHNTPGFWDGRIDELALFHHALTPDQILRLYQGTREILASTGKN